MCSVEPLREFIRERLTAAAEEICSQLERTIVHFEEEMDRQRRLLDITWRPRLSLQPADLPHHYDCKEKEVQTSQQPCYVETNSSLDQERPEPRQVMKDHEEPEFLQVNIKLEEPELLQLKEEQSETGISQFEESLVLNQQTDTIMMKEGDHGEPEPGEDQLPSQNAPEAENLNQKGSLDKDSGLSRAEVLNLNNRDETKPKRNKVGKRAFCKICGKSFSPCYLYDHIRTHTGEKRFSCKTCGKRFIQSSQLTCHMRTHTGEKPYPCQMCGKRFNQKYTLDSHMKIHSAENLNQKGSLDKDSGLSRDEMLKQNNRDKTKPKRQKVEKRAFCKICGKSFSPCYLYDHIRTHTGEKRFSCKTCGKRFIQNSQLTCHMRTHTGEKPYPCQMCGKRFNQKYTLDSHMKIHSAENLNQKGSLDKDSGLSRDEVLNLNNRDKTKPKRQKVVKRAFCQICGKSFSPCYLYNHIRTHTGEKRFSCKTCGKRFIQSSQLTRHMRTHTGEKPFSC